ncbi:MAG: hypothetical protein Fur006_62430 [Coleofasciculaceae cyanobacterium]
MVENELPIGSILKEVTILEDQEFGGDEVCLDRVQLIFQDAAVILQPLSDTDEIELIVSSVPSLLNQVPSPSESTPIDSPTWCSSLLGKKLQMVWVCENHQGYRDQVIFAFEQLHPSIAFICEGSVLKVYCYQQITHALSTNTPLKHSQV